MKRTLATLAFLATLAVAGAAQAQNQLPFTMPAQGSCTPTGTMACLFVSNQSTQLPTSAIRGNAVGGSRAIVGTATSGIGVNGTAASGSTAFGVLGEADGAATGTGAFAYNGRGLWAYSPHGKGAFIESANNDAMEVKASAADKSGIYVHHEGGSGSTYGVFAQTVSGSGHSVHAVNTVGGYAIYANGPSGGTTGWANLSDRRAKKGIVVISGAEGARIVEAIEPVTYEWKDTNRPGRFVGFTAQNLRDAIPGSTRVDNATGMLMADPTATIPPLVAYVKELERRLAKLEKRK